MLPYSSDAKVGASVTFASVVSSCAFIEAGTDKSTQKMNNTTHTTISDATSDPAETRLSIIPRFKTSQNRQQTPPASSPSPVVITTAVIDSLRGLPVPHAARSIGVSVTAFKRACRRLGVNRWQYARGPGRRAGGRLLHLSPVARAGGARRGSDSAIFPQRTAVLPWQDAGGAPIGHPCDVLPSAAGADRSGAAARTGIEDWAEEAGWAGGRACGWADAVEDDALVLLLLAQQWP